MELTDKVKTIAQTLSNKKAQNINIIYVGDKTIIADYFIIASASSATHVSTLAEEVDEQASKAGYPPIRAEGIREGRWAILDFGDVFVHVFHNEERDFYNLERLWADETNCITYTD